MKQYTVLVCVLSVILLGGKTAYAQVDKPYYTDDSHTLFVPKRTVLFPLSEYSAEKVQRERFANKWGSDYVNTLLFDKKVRVSSDTNIPVIGYTKSGVSVKDYDYYIVEYNGQLCYLPKDSCPDNSLIDSKNAEIISYYRSMQQELIDLSEEFLYRVTVKAQNAINELTSLNDRKNYLIDSTSTAQIQQKEAKMKEEYEAWRANLNDIGLKASKIIAIHSSELSSPNSAAGCDYMLSYSNNSSKTIKYLDWKGNAYNAVNDIVSCDIRNTTLLQGRETGPIEAHQEGGGHWETIIYNWSAKELRLTGITITYLDGTKASLTGKEISAITGAPFMRLSLGQKALIKADVDFEIEKRIRALEEESKYLSTPENARYTTVEDLKEEVGIFKRIDEIGKEMNSYRYRNSIPSWDDAPTSVKRLIVIY
jgi:hypothetical protein